MPISNSLDCSENYILHIFKFRAQPFPKKYSALPGIGSTSPLPNDDNQIIAYNNGPTPRFADDSSDRMYQLESRVAVAEKSNRALLEECVRLQVKRVKFLITLALQ